MAPFWLVPNFSVMSHAARVRCDQFGRSKAGRVSRAKECSHASLR